MGHSQVSPRVIGGAVLLVVALAGSAVAQSPSPAPSAAASVAPSVPAASPTAPVALGSIKWKRVTKGKDFTTNPGAYTVGQLPDGRLVVLGTIGNQTGQTTGAGWVSADGSKWARLKLKAPKGSAITAITTLDGIIVATGTAGAGLEVADGLVWTSPDGTAWSPGTIVGGQIYSLLPIPGGLVGAGLLGDSATVWTTTDAITWTPVTLATQGRGIHVMADPAGTLVIAGAVGGMVSGASSPAVWTSGDGGVTWTETIFDGLLPGFWSIPAAAVTPFGFLVTLTEHGQSGNIGRIWTSSDGSAWTESFVNQKGGLLAAGSVGTDALVIGNGQVLRSSDGVTWTQTDQKSFDVWNVRDVMTLADGRLFAAGDAFVGPMGSAASALATWTGTAEPAP